MGGTETIVSYEDIEQIFNNLLTKHIVDKCNRPGYKPPSQLAGEFDEKSFSLEEYDPSQNPSPNPRPSGWESPQGRLQKIQSDLQDEIDYTYDETDIAQSWSISLFGSLNRYLFKGTHRGDERCTSDSDGNPLTFKEASDLLSSVIQKSPSAQESFVTYRYGPFEYDLDIGEHGVFDGFQSTSFNPYVAEHAIHEQVGGWMKNNRSLIRVFNPKGTKGVVIDETVGCDDWQSEWLLDKGQKFIVVDRGTTEINGKTVPTVDVLLY